MFVSYIIHVEKIGIIVALRRPCCTYPIQFVYIITQIAKLKFISD